MFAQKSRLWTIKKQLAFKCCWNSFHYATMIFHFFFSFIIPFIHLNFLPNSSSLIVKILYDGCDDGRSIHWIRFFIYVEFQATTFFFKYNRNYALESHLLSYDSTCEKQLIIIYSFEDLEKNMIWWVVFSLRYIVKFGSRKIFGDNKFLISIVFKKWSNRNNLNTTRWLKSVF